MKMASDFITPMLAYRYRMLTVGYFHRNTSFLRITYVQEVMFLLLIHIVCSHVGHTYLKMEANLCGILIIFRCIYLVFNLFLLLITSRKEKT